MLERCDILNRQRIENGGVGVRTRPQLTAIHELELTGRDRRREKLADICTSAKANGQQLILLSGAISIDLPLEKAL